MLINIWNFIGHSYTYSCSYMVDVDTFPRFTTFVCVCWKYSKHFFHSETKPNKPENYNYAYTQNQTSSTLRMAS